jgi:hypothetical protein
MSPKFLNNTAVAVFLVAFAAFLAGCGENDNAGPSVLPGQDRIEVTPGTGGTGDSVSAATGATSGAPSVDEEAGRGGRGPDAAAPGQSGAGDEEAARAPVDVSVRDSAFTGSTTRRVHVPAFFPIELTVEVESSADEKLKIFNNEEGGTFRFRGGSKRVMPLGGLRPGRTYVITTSKGQKVRIVADAEPGP